MLMRFNRPDVYGESSKNTGAINPNNKIADEPVPTCHGQTVRFTTVKGVKDVDAF
ncbi:hypothetical protein VS873_23885 [Salmonella enterica subsp. enterica serovar Typhi]|nr:hypothetical protein [Salmonella enterica subsp. enterica serovar Typhi]